MAEKTKESPISKAYLQSVLDAIDAPILLVVGTDYRVMLMNKAAREFAQTERPSFCYQVFHHRDIPCPSTGAEHACTIEEVKRTGMPVVVEHEHYRKDGELRTIEIHASPLRDDEGNIMGVIEFCLDVTEQRASAKALSESRDRLSSLFSQASDCIMLLDPMPGGPPIIVDINEAGCSMHGYTREEVIGKPITFLDHPESAKLAPERASRMMKGESLQFEVMHIRKDGSTFPVEVSARVVEIGEEKFIQAIDRDITERKRTEAALRESEDKFSVLYNQASDSILLLEPAGDTALIVDANRAACAMHGYAKEELIGKPITFLDAPEDVKRVPELIGALVAGGIRGYEIRHVRKDGSAFPIEASAQMVDIGGKKFIQTIYRDITDRKKTEAELRHSLERNRALINAIPDLIFRIDKNGTYIDFESAKGFPTYLAPKDFLGKKIGDVMPEDMGREAMSFIGRALETGEPQVFEYQLAYDDGSVLHFEARIVKSGIDEVTAIVRDITDRKRAEERLRLFSAALEQARDGIQMVDLDGRITYSNKAVENIYGYTPEEFRGRHVNELNVDPELAGRVILPVIRDRGQWDGELMVKHKDGRHFPIWLSTAVVRDDAGKQIAMVGIIKDITELKKTEERIASSLREKEVLLREIHHRVKNNMQVVLSLLKLQSRYFKDERYLEMLNESRDRIKAMAFVHEKLYESKDLASLDFCEYVHGLAAGLFRSYDIHSGRVTLHISCTGVKIGLDAAIPCGLILNELISNSLKHAFPEKREGAVNIAVEAAGESEYMLQVSDDGVGMPGEVDLGKTLGLQLVTTLTKQIGGRLELRRERGTEFIINFKEKKH